MIPINNIINTLLEDRDPLEAGFQPSNLYILVCLMAPFLFGTIVGLTATCIQKIINRKQ